MLSRILKPHTDTAYFVLRVVFGLLFAFHGAQKLFGWYMPYPIEVGSQAWIGGVIELVTGLAVAAGFLTTWAAFLASGTMAVAYIQFHWKLQGGSMLLPVVNEGEPALLYAFVFLFIACRGGGKWSAWQDG